MNETANNPQAAPETDAAGEGEQKLTGKPYDRIAALVDAIAVLGLFVIACIGVQLARDAIFKADVPGNAVGAAAALAVSVLALWLVLRFQR